MIRSTAVRHRRVDPLHRARDRIVAAERRALLRRLLRVADVLRAAGGTARKERGREDHGEGSEGSIHHGLVSWPGLIAAAVPGWKGTASRENPPNPTRSPCSGDPPDGSSVYQGARE